jgi:hypothetical protein
MLALDKTPKGNQDIESVVTTDSMKELKKLLKKKEREEYLLKMKEGQRKHVQRL